MPPARKALPPPSHPTSRGSFRRRYPPYWSDSHPRLPPIPAHLPGERRQLPVPWPSLTIPATCHFNLFLNRRFWDNALDDGEQRIRPACRTLVRDGGSWSEQLELDLDVEGYYTLISLPLSHSASQLALEQAARRGAMKPLGGKLEEVRAARLRTRVGELDRTLVVVESQELLRGQKRGIAVALSKAKEELRKLEPRPRSSLPTKITADLQRFEKLKAAVTQIEYFSKGTVLARMVKCGRPKCLCGVNPKKRH